MKAVDLFAGCGGLSLGFEMAGFDVVAAFEWWDAAIECYRSNFSHHPIMQLDLSDIDKTIDEIRRFSPDIIIGSPPFQDFSHAGKIESDYAELAECYEEIIGRISPDCFVMESVDRARNCNAYASARKAFKEFGYGLTEIVLDASLCGTPQKRKCFICFGMKGKPDGFALDSFKRRLADKPMTLRDYFGDALGFEFYYRHPYNCNMRAVFSIDEPALTMRGVNHPVPKNYPRHKNDACPVTSDLHVLTTEEWALIQTFPRDYKWVGSKTDVVQMIGNAVPVNLAKFVGETVKAVMENDVYASNSGIQKMARRCAQVAAAIDKLKSMTYEEWQNGQKPKQTGKAQVKPPVRSQAYTDVMAICETEKVEYIKAYKQLGKPLESDEIIKKLSGRDMTGGSCSSLAFAYIANKCGLDVMDYRGGRSRAVFSRNAVIKKGIEPRRRKCHAEQLQ